MKFFTAVCFFILAGLLSFSQCIPDTNITHNDPGTYPDSATGLPRSLVGQPYSTVIQIKILTDSTVGSQTGVVDSIVINDVTGLPTDFSYLCTPGSCSFPGGSNACILLQGLPPTISMVRNYPLIVHTTIYFKLGGTPLQLQDNNDDYSIRIDTTTGIGSIENVQFNVGQSLPNPAKENALIPVTLSRPDDVNLKIVNLIGKKVFSKTYSLPRGKTNIPVDLKELQPGIYLYTVSNSLNSIAKRMIISND
jgi:hypothetical protein